MVPWIAAYAAVGLIAETAVSGTYTWDNDGAAPLSDGSGAWSASGGQNWFDGISTYGAWGNTVNDSAVFGAANGAAGSIAVGTVNANRITFNAPGSGSYTLSGGTITLSGSSPTIAANAGATIGSVLIGTAGLTKAGAGTLTLSGINTYNGNTTITGGTFKITGGIYTDQYRTTIVTVQNGAILELNTWAYGSSQSLGQLAAEPERLVVNNGTIRVNGSTSYGRGVTLTGPATLEAATGSNWTMDNTTDNRNWIFNNNAIELTGAGTGAFQKNFSGSGGLTKNGTGTWTLSGTNTYSGGTAVNAGTLRFVKTYSLPASGKVTVNGASVAACMGGTGEWSAGTIGGFINALTCSGTSKLLFDTANAASTQTCAGNITNAGSSLAITKLGAGTLILSGTNTYGGGTTISGGALQFATTNAMPAAGTTTVSSGGLGVNVGGPDEWNTGTSGAGTIGGLLNGVGGQIGSAISYSGAATLVLDTTQATGTQTYSGIITNVGSSLGLTKSGSGTLTLSARSTYSGNTTVNGGTLKLSGGIYTDTHRTAVVTVQNNGVLELNTWYYGAGESLGMLSADTAQIVVNNGTIRVNGNTSYGRGVTLTGPATLEAAAGANWIIDTTSTGSNLRSWIYNNNPIVLAGAGIGDFQKGFSGSGGVTKNGTGTWTLSGTNTYSGSTAINAGTLKLGAIGAISNSPTIAVASGAIYNVAAISGYTIQPKQTLSGNGAVTGSVTVANGGILAAGGTNATGTLSFSSNLTLAENAVIDWNYGDSTQDLIAVAGTLTLPTVATVNVSRVSGTLPVKSVLFTFGSVSPSAPDLTHWVLTGVPANTRASVRTAPNRVVFVTPTGTLIRVL